MEDTPGLKKGHLAIVVLCCLSIATTLLIGPDKLRNREAGLSYVATGLLLVVFMSVGQRCPVVARAAIAIIAAICGFVGVAFLIFG